MVFSSGKVCIIVLLGQRDISPVLAALNVMLVPGCFHVTTKTVPCVTCPASSGKLPPVCVGGGLGVGVADLNCDWLC